MFDRIKTFLVEYGQYLFYPLIGIAMGAILGHLFGIYALYFALICLGICFIMCIVESYKNDK